MILITTLTLMVTYAVLLIKINLPAGDIDRPLI
ncbi:hypothetical protein Metlim_1794 [Methanoplanus limicola DSM 2279]|uniref:Uncharacterized protein n=1 Tax=Methanoplanus limicola DSM 2279 TaxID=937775 RepID=H1YX92_9EURY|nr:hypothetical protein Metlim_1794 [Methanoplanus limicola DSM 2279]